MLHEIITSVIGYLQAHPLHAGIIVWAIACTESLAVIGSLIPGSVTMTAVGALIGSGALPEYETLAWAVFGAFFGDYVSYWFGHAYKEHIREIKIIKRYERWLDQGEVFFKKHGGKSIIIGRFFGPMRSMVPMVAGTLDMPKGRFILAALPSALMWALLYLTPGYCFAKYGVKFDYDRLGHDALYAVAVIFGIWLVYFCLLLLMRPILNRLAAGLETWRQKLPNCLSKGGGLFFDVKQFTLWIAILVCAILFINLSVFVVEHRNQIHLNQTVFIFLNQHEQAWLQGPMLLITYLGNKLMLASFVALFSLWLVWKRCWRTAHYFVVTSMATAVVTYGLKLALRLPRPGSIHLNALPAYPSGHTTLAVAIIGFITYLVCQKFRVDRRHWGYLKFSLLIICIAASRLYLKAHWFSDALGGMLLGAFILFITIVLYRRQEDLALRTQPYCTLAISLLLLSWLGYGILHFNTDVSRLTQYTDDNAAVVFYSPIK